MEGTNITEKAVLCILSSQQNLEHIESEFLTAALLKLASEHGPAEDLRKRGSSLTRLCLKSQKCGAPNIDLNHVPDNELGQYLKLLQKLGEQTPKIQYLTIPRLCSNQLNVLYETLPSLPCLAHLYLGEVKVNFRNFQKFDTF